MPDLARLRPTWDQVQELLRTPRAVDSIQLQRQPQGTASALWATELWDVRAARRGAPARVADRFLGWLNGSQCAHADHFDECNACRGSQLEGLCFNRSWQAYCDTPMGIARMRRGRSGQCGWPDHTAGAGGVEWWRLRTQPKAPRNATAMNRAASRRGKGLPGIAANCRRMSTL